MSRLVLEAGRRDLDKCLRRLAEARARFADAPVRGLAAFIEGVSHRDQIHIDTPGPAARLLGTDPGRVLVAKPHEYATPPRPHSGPYYAYLPNEVPAESLAAQVAALRPILGGFLQILAGLPTDATAALLPAELSSGWEAVFHLATHFPRTFHGSTRTRWGIAPARMLAAHREARQHDQARGLPAVPFDKVLTSPAVFDEQMIRSAGGPADLDDIIPGVVWAGLRNDVWMSAEAAIECVRDHLAPQPSEPPADFTRLHADFTAIGRAFPTTADTIRTRVPRVVKFASTFDVPATHHWCDFPMRMTFDRLPLSRHHADAEYAVYHGVSEEEQELWADAGAALPSDVPDAAVMFSTAELNEHGGYNFGRGCGPAYLNPDPAARWVRFVFNMLKGDGVTVRWVNKPTGRAEFIEPQYGDAVLATDFAAASARAIERAGLLQRRAAPASTTDNAAPSPPSPEPLAAAGRGRRATYDPHLDRCIAEAAMSGVAVERLVKEYGQSAEWIAKAIKRHNQRPRDEAKRRK